MILRISVLPQQLKLLHISRRFYNFKELHDFKFTDKK